MLYIIDLATSNTNTICIIIGIIATYAISITIATISAYAFIIPTITNTIIYAMKISQIPFIIHKRYSSY